MNVQRSFHPQYHDEVPLSKAPNPHLLPGHYSINCYPLLRVCVHGVCVFTAVCVHLGWVKCRAHIMSMGHHTWPYVTYSGWCCCFCHSVAFFGVYWLCFCFVVFVMVLEGDDPS